MELMQRFGCVYTDEYVDGYIEQMVKHKGSCDNVWIPTSYNYPSLEKHREYADFWKRTAEKLRAAGIGVSLQISNTLGHGDRPYGDCEGLVFEGSPVRVMVGPDGESALTCFCPRDPFFKNYMETSVSYYAEIQPEQIWVDDDFRARGHGAARFGCFCDHCISDFNTANGTSFSREELVSKVLYGDLIWREKWIAFTRESLTTMLKDLAAAVHKVAPKAIFSYQHGGYGSYTGYSLDFVFDAMREANGGIAPASRPGGGAYSERDVNSFIQKAMALSYQKSMLPAYVKRSVPEIENLPHNVFGKSPAGTAFETSLYFATGHTDMSYSMIMNQNEPMEWHGNTFAAFAKHRPYWERLSDCNKVTRAAGIRYYQSEHVWRKKLADGAGFDALNVEPYNELQVFARDAIPYVYDKREESVFFLHPETAKDVSAEELTYLLAHNVVTDGESIDILQKRGFDFGIPCKEYPNAVANGIMESYCDHPVKPADRTGYRASIYGSHRQTVYMMLPPSSGAEVLATYTCTREHPAIFDDPEAPLGVSEMIISTKTGGKWAILGYVPWCGNIPLYRRDMLLDIIDHISGNALPARLITPMPAMLLPRKDEKGRVACISLVNCTVGESGELELLVRNPAAERFTLISQHNGTHALAFRRKGDDYIVTLPSISAWSVATVFVG